MHWTEKDLIGPDGVNRGYPNNVSRAATLDMEERIRARFGEDAVIEARRVAGARSDWNKPKPRGDMSLYGADYRDPLREKTFAEEMDEKDPEWREAAFADGPEESL